MRRKIQDIEATDPVFFSHIMDICAGLLCEDVKGYIAIARIYCNGTLRVYSHKSYYEGGYGYSSRIFPLLDGFTPQNPYTIDKQGLVKIADYSVSDPMKEDLARILYSGGTVLINPTSTIKEEIFALPVGDFFSIVGKVKLA